MYSVQWQALQICKHTNDVWPKYLQEIWNKSWITRHDHSIGVTRAVEKFLSSRLIMNSRQLWNSHQRHKFLRAKASRDILKFRVLEMAFPVVFKRCFPLHTPCCFITIHARQGKMPSQCPGCSTTLYGSNVSQI